MESRELLPRAMKPVAAGVPQLRVLSWNVLSDQLSVNFPMVPENVLEWTYREPLIQAELLRANADILCLQEVDHFDSLSAFLSQLGYDGAFQQKTDWHRDGTAVFYRTSVLQLLSLEKVQFTRRSQNYLLLKLQHKPLGLPFVVVATHLKSYAKYERIRVLQVQQILTHLAPLYHLPIVFAGDFNSAPLRPVYTLLSSSLLKFHSAYLGALRPGEEPEFTCMAVREKLAKTTIDYIWVKGWSPCAVMTIPSELEIGERGLPCGKYPSDHIALVCDLCLPVRL